MPNQSEGIRLSSVTSLWPPDFLKVFVYIISFIVCPLSHDNIQVKYKSIIKIKYRSSLPFWVQNFSKSFMIQIDESWSLRGHRSAACRGRRWPWTTKLTGRWNITALFFSINNYVTAIMQSLLFVALAADCFIRSKVKELGAFWTVSMTTIDPAGLLLFEDFYWA